MAEEQSKDAATAPPTTAKAPATARAVAPARAEAPKRVLNLGEELARMRKAYSDDARNQAYKAIVYGASGSGKTTSLRTARLPLLVHSFDPGGTKALEDMQLSGQAILNTTFEVDDPEKPSAFKAWDQEYDRLETGGFFAHVGTYVIDSLTTWAQCAMFEILKRAGRPGGVPQQNDWYPQMNLIELACRKLLALPCDVILIAHDAVDKDEQTGKIFRNILVTGKLSKRLPILFDELYFANTKDTPKGVDYSFMTKGNGSIEAKTRLGKDGKLEQFVPQNFKEILKKVGYSTEDKPLWRFE